MPTKTTPHPTTTHARSSSALSLLPEWVRQGTESFFATQRILLDLVTRQNANMIHAVRERLADISTIPTEALTEMAGEGISNFIAAQRVLLNLAQRQNEIVMTGVKDRTGGNAPVAAMTDLVRRGLDTFIDMQQHFLTLASKQTDAWIDATKSGEVFSGRGLAEMAREAMESFVRSQKKLLDVIAEETAHAAGAKQDGATAGRKTHVAELARQATEAFIDAQKKLLDLATQQANVNAKTARRTIDALNPFPSTLLSDLTRQTVDTFGAAQKALIDMMPKTGDENVSEAAPKKAAHKRAHHAAA